MLDNDAEPGTLDSRLDEPLPNEVTAEQARRLALRRQARENKDALAALRGLPAPR